MRPHAIVAFCVFLVAGLATTAVLAADPIRIGAPFNVTGALASLDGPALNGARLKLKEINDAGGVLGRKLELVFYDTKTEPTVIAATAARLINKDRVPVAIGFTDSDSVLTLGPIFQQAGIPFVTPGATSPQLPGQVGDDVFLACFGDNVQAAAGAEFVIDKLGGKHVYLLRDSATHYTVLLARYFDESFTHDGGQIVGRDDYRSGDKSFAGQIARIKASAVKPDVIYISAMPDDIGAIVKQLREGGIVQPVVGGDGYDTPLLVQVAGTAAANVYYSTHAYMAPDSTPGIRKFYRDYKAAYGTDPENAFAALGYDTLGLVADAIGRAGTADPVRIRDALAATDGYSGITGSISYRNGIRVPAKTVTMIGVKAGQLYLAGEIKPNYIAAP